MRLFRFKAFEACVEFHVDRISKNVIMELFFWSNKGFGRFRNDGVGLLAAERERLETELGFMAEPDILRERFATDRQSQVN